MNDSCGNPVSCGTCQSGQTCSGAGQCQGGGTTCAGCVDESGACQTAHNGQFCGLGGETCTACRSDQLCVSGECTCTSNSCNQGCCENNICDNTKRRCGNRCIPKTACCHDNDRTEGCRPNETCQQDTGNQFGGAAQCVCGIGRCFANQGCCEANPGDTPNPRCNTDLRPCGDICIDKEQCCNDGQVGCEDGVSCTTNTCVPASVTGQARPPSICQTTFPSGVCTEACAAGEGYGNGYPNNKEVPCGPPDASGLSCYCWRRTEGGNACTRDFYSAPECRTTADCPANTACIRTGLDGGKHRCAPVCR